MHHACGINLDDILSTGESVGFLFLTIFFIHLFVIQSLGTKQTTQSVRKQLFKFSGQTFPEESSLSESRPSAGVTQLSCTLQLTQCHIFHPRMLGPVSGLVTSQIQQLHIELSSPGFMFSLFSTHFFFHKVNFV